MNFIKFNNMDFTIIIIFTIWEKNRQNKFKFN
jgi:uncharacterized membrane protein YqjE